MSVLNQGLDDKNQANELKQLKQKYQKQAVDSLKIIGYASEGLGKALWNGAKTSIKEKLHSFAKSRVWGWIKDGTAKATTLPESFQKAFNGPGFEAIPEQLEDLKALYKEMKVPENIDLGKTEVKEAEFEKSKEKVVEVKEAKEAKGPVVGPEKNEQKQEKAKIVKVEKEKDPLTQKFEKYLAEKENVKELANKLESLEKQKAEFENFKTTYGSIAFDRSGYKIDFEKCIEQIKGVREKLESFNPELRIEKLEQKLQSLEKEKEYLEKEKFNLGDRKFKAFGLEAKIEKCERKIEEVKKELANGDMGSHLKEEFSKKLQGLKDEKKHLNNAPRKQKKRPNFQKKVKELAQEIAKVQKKLEILKKC